MHIVWEIEYLAEQGRAEVRTISRVVRPVSGFTDDPTIVALACCAFAHRFWVQLHTDASGRITVLNVLPDCSLPPWPPAPATKGLAVSGIRVAHRAGKWPDMEVDFADGQVASDRSGAGLLEPIIRAAVTSGEGVYDLLVSEGVIQRVLLMNEAPASEASDPRSAIRNADARRSA